MAPDKREPNLPAYTKNRVIGLLGGSFNPAHEGHLHITLYALKTLQLDEVWWLVSPQNPLKAKESLAAYAKRLESARAVAAAHPKIRVLDIEMRLRAHYTYQSIARLKQRFPGAHFVWLMGADNLAQFHRWQRWQEIIGQVPVVVFDRAPHSHTALRSKAFLRNRKFLLKNRCIISPERVPALYFIHLRREALSSTKLRKTLGDRAFLRHNKVMGSR